MSSNLLGVPDGFCMFMAQVFFLWHLNTLNLDVQEQEKSNADLVGRPCTFKTDLRIFTNDLSVQMLHFYILSWIECMGCKLHTWWYISWWNSLRTFSIPIEILKKDPFSIKPGPDLRICESKRSYVIYWWESSRWSWLRRYYCLEWLFMIH